MDEEKKKGRPYSNKTIRSRFKESFKGSDLERRVELETLRNTLKEEVKGRIQRKRIDAKIDKLLELTVHDEVTKKDNSIASAILNTIQNRLQEQAGMGDVEGMLESLATTATMKVAELMEGGDSDKIKLEASKILMYAAGYKPVEKRMSLNANINKIPEDQIDQMLESKLLDLDKDTQKELVRMTNANKRRRSSKLEKEGKKQIIMDVEAEDDE